MECDVPKELGISVIFGESLVYDNHRNVLRIVEIKDSEWYVVGQTINTTAPVFCHAGLDWLTDCPKNWELA